MFRLIGVISVVVWGAGCTNSVFLTPKDNIYVVSQPPSEELPVVTVEEDEWQRLFSEVALGSVDRQQALRSVLEAQVSESPSLEKRLQLAFLLGFSEPVIRDERRAMKIFNEIERDVSKDLAEQAMPSFVSLLFRDMSEDFKRMEDLRAINAQLDEANRQSKQYAHSLEKKLNAIKSIEESINQRSR